MISIVWMHITDMSSQVLQAAETFLLDVSNDVTQTLIDADRDDETELIDACNGIHLTALSSTASSATNTDATLTEDEKDRRRRDFASIEETLKKASEGVIVAGTADEYRR